MFHKTVQQLGGKLADLKVISSFMTVPAPAQNQVWL